MKLKTEFITNLSSSSFVVIGSTIDADKIIGLKRGDAEDPYDVMESLLKGSDLSWSTGCEYGDGEMMVGLCYTVMKDDETLADFKERVKQEIKRTLHVDTEVGHIEECWMDN